MISKNDSNYWYNYVDINTLLLNLAQGIHYEVIEATSADDLQSLQRINEAFEIIKNPNALNVVVIPINLGQTINGIYNGSHWASLVIKKTDDINYAYYNDSFGTPLESSLPNLVTILNNHGVSWKNIHDFQTHQQSNGYDCGPWTVMNLDSFARVGGLPMFDHDQIYSQIALQRFSLITYDSDTNLNIADSICENSFFPNYPKQNNQRVAEKAEELNGYNNDTPLLKEECNTVQISENHKSQRFINHWQVFSKIYEGMAIIFPDQTDSSRYDQNSQVYFENLVKKTLESATSFKNLQNIEFPIMSCSNAMTKTENQTIKEAILRSGILLRPQHFQIPEKIETFSREDYGFHIAFQFYKEFIRSENFSWAQEWCKVKLRDHNEMSESQKNAGASLADTLFNLFKMSISEYNPYTDPLNKYVNKNELKQAIQLKEFLLENPDCKGFDYYQNIFIQLDSKIIALRHKAITYGLKYAVNLVKAMIAEEGICLDPETIKENLEESSWSNKRKDFEKYITNEFFKIDFKNLNVLNAFQEYVYRNQLQEIYYEVLLESFDLQYVESYLHKAINEIYKLTVLDFVNSSSLEAHPTMPVIGINGHEGENFSYATKSSKSYQSWLKNTLALSVGDIIIDALNYCVDQGNSLDIERFLHIFELHYDVHSNQNFISRYLNVNDVDKRIKFENDFAKSFPNYNLQSDTCIHWIMETFEKFILETKFEVSFDEEFFKSRANALKSLSNNDKSLILSYAREVLEEMSNFTKYIYNLQNNLNSAGSGFILGIGFNGELFDSPNYFNKQKDNNEVWLCFSYRGRNTGGTLLLKFIELMVHESDFFLTTESQEKLTEKISEDFPRYKSLIGYRIDKMISYYSSKDISQYPRAYREMRANDKNKYDNFKLQLDMYASFHSLTDDFKNWILKFNNWFYIPYDIKVEDNSDVDDGEIKLHKLTRELVFDSVNKRSFTLEYEDLTPLLYLHWKDKIVSSITDIDYKQTILNTNSYQELPEDLKKSINGYLDTLINNVHEEVIKVWKSKIDSKFIEFKNIKNEYISTLLIKKSLNEKDIDVLQNKLEENLEALKNKCSYTKLDKDVYQELKKELENLRKDNNLDKSAKKEIIELIKILNNIHKVSNKLVKTNNDIEEYNSLYEDLLFKKNCSNLKSQVYDEFKSFFFESRKVDQCAEFLLASKVGHDHFFPVFIDSECSIPIINGNDSGKELKLGTVKQFGVTPPCDDKCQHHVIGHILVAEMRSKNTIDDLRDIRSTHEKTEVLDQFMTFEESDASLNMMGNNGSCSLM